MHIPAKAPTEPIIAKANNPLVKVFDRDGDGDGEVSDGGGGGDGDGGGGDGSRGGGTVV